MLPVALQMRPRCRACIAAETAMSALWRVLLNACQLEPMLVCVRGFIAKRAGACQWQMTSNFPKRQWSPCTLHLPAALQTLHQFDERHEFSLSLSNQHGDARRSTEHVANCTAFQRSTKSTLLMKHASNTYLPKRPVRPALCA